MLVTYGETDSNRNSFGLATYVYRVGSLPSRDSLAWMAGIFQMSKLWPEDGSDSDPRWEGPEGHAVLEQMVGHSLPQPMCERLIQNKLYVEFESRRHRLIVPNTTLLGWESDLVSVTAAGFLCEYEIKISRSDFRADLKKIRHRILDASMINEKHRGPAYFYYAVPCDMVGVEELPEYAGLIYVHPILQIIKKAPRLNKGKITEHQVAWLQRSIMARFWKERLKK